jgi:hypothetical protein
MKRGKPRFVKRKAETGNGFGKGSEHLNKVFWKPV